MADSQSVADASQVEQRSGDDNVQVGGRDARVQDQIYEYNERLQQLRVEIEEDYQNLRGVFLKGDYHELDTDVLRQLLRMLKPDEFKRVWGDVFGHISEYCLAQFADQ